MKTARRDHEAELRRLGVYYEWSTPPNMAAADALQAAADAYKEGTLSDPAADALIAVWQPFVGIEARARKQRPPTATVETTADLQRAVIADIRRMIARCNDSAKRLHLTSLLEAQIRTFAQRGNR